MRSSRKLVHYSALALLFTVPLALPAFAQPGHHSEGRPGADRPLGPHGDGLFSGLMLERLAERLGLSEGQVEEIRAVHERHRPDLDPLTEHLRVARTELSDQVHADVFDENAIREAASRVGALEADLAVLRARVAGDVHQILTPEQVAQARQMREHFKNFAEDRRGRFGRGHRPAPSEDD